MKKLSIVIVNYKTEKEIVSCLKSIRDKIKNLSFEVLVVDNDVKSKLGKKVRNFNFVRYIKSDGNLGYSAGNNLGVKNALGEFIFILNPDTEIEKGNIKTLLSKFSNKKIGIIAPELVSKNGENFENQGSKKLTPISAIFSTSIIHKIWPNNPIAREYLLKNLKRSGFHEVDVVPGTAFIIRKKLFEKISGFDEKFFLYFEEDDLCSRVKNLGYKILMTPHLKVVHLWGISTSHIKNRDGIFKRSRFYYFKKHYGFVEACFTTFILNISLRLIILTLIIVSGFFLRIYKLGTLMMFISDQGWFYLSARDMILFGKIPLVGITSSHTWLHQGSFWTYLLAVSLVVGRFNPVSGAYLAVIFGVGSIILIYKIGKRFISQDFGLIAAFLYAFSPLVIINERMAYHTAPISFFVLLLIYSVNRFVRNNPYFFPVSLFVVSVLYNFELATVVFWPAIFLVLVYGYIKRDKWFKSLKSSKIIVLSIVMLIFPMVPVILYDFSHGFTQTIKYGAWLIYKPFFGTRDDPFLSKSFIEFSNLHIASLILIQNSIISILILLVSIIYVSFKIRKANYFELIIFLFTIIPLSGYIISSTSSEAYLPMFFPGIILCISYLVYKLLFIKFKLIGLSLIIILAFSNIYSLLSQNYLMNINSGYGLTIKQREIATLEILKLAGGGKYDLSYKAKGVKFTNLDKNYRYLAWLYGNEPLITLQKIKIFVYEDGNGIKVSKLK